MPTARRRWMRRPSTKASWLFGCVIAAFLSSVTPSVVQAQGDIMRVQAGDSLRVRLPGSLPIKAEFRAWDGEYMMLDIRGVGGEWPVSVFEMQALELYTVRTPQESFRHGAILGAVSGLFIGAALGLALHSVGVTDDPDGPPAQMMTSTLRGAGLGFAVGAIGGGLYLGRNPGEGWVSIRLPGG